MSKPEQFIANAKLVVSHFGYWPSFHDNEIRKITLDRNNITAKIEIYAFATSKKTNENREYERVKQCDIVFKFSGIKEIELKGFNNQNVIDEINFRQEKNNVLISIESGFGVNGNIVCKSVVVESIST